jgi:hypothetical protein
LNVVLAIALTEHVNHKNVLQQELSADIQMIQNTGLNMTVVKVIGVTVIFA